MHREKKLLQKEGGDSEVLQLEAPAIWTGGDQTVGPHMQSDSCCQPGEQEAQKLGL